MLPKRIISAQETGSFLIKFCSLTPLYPGMQWPKGLGRDSSFLPSKKGPKKQGPKVTASLHLVFLLFCVFTKYMVNDVHTNYHCFRFTHVVFMHALIRKNQACVKHWTGHDFFSVIHTIFIRKQMSVCNTRSMNIAHSLTDHNNNYVLLECVCYEH